MAVFGLKNLEKKVMNEIFQNIDMVRSGYELNLFPKNEVNPPKGLGGVR